MDSFKKNSKVATDVESELLQNENGSYKQKETLDSLERQEITESGVAGAESLASGLEEQNEQIEELKNKLMFQRAEFDNFKRRTARDKENTQTLITCDVVAAFLPVLDNISRALEASDDLPQESPLLEGIKLMARQFDEALKSVGVEEVVAIDTEFDPQWHNAVAHIDSQEFGKNVVTKELAKGYKFRDKVIRYAMVEVAN